LELPGLETRFAFGHGFEAFTGETVLPGLRPAWPSSFRGPSRPDRVPFQSGKIAMTKTSATLIGFSAVLMWGLLAFLSKTAAGVPPLQLLAMCFFIGGLVGLATWPFRPGAARVLMSQAWQVWVLNVAALFGCHLLYFIATRNAPIVEVSLLAYLWPLLIVVFSAFVPGEKLQWHHVVGVVLGLLGAFLVISKGQGFGLAQGLQLGHLIAIPYAILWAGFSVTIRRFGAIPSDIVTGFCFVCAVLAGGAHLMVEATAWTLSADQWLAVIALGILPMGAAFYAWDFGMKRGDTMILGAASYVAPLLSTLVLFAVGMTEYHWSIAAACVLITGGAVIAAKDMIFSRA
jgi:drug/metabolite transporter (DMT)-like permease